MGPPLKLTVDRQNRKLVAYLGTPTSLPDLFQSNTITLQVQIVDPGPSSFPQVAANQQYTVVNSQAFGLRAAVGDTPEGVTGPTPLALQDTFVYDPVNQWFTADLALNTAGIDTFLGTSAAKPAYFELNLTINGTRITILQVVFNLRAVVDELNNNVPTPQDKYLTAAEIVGQFVPRQMAPGDTIVLVSPDGHSGIELGVNNDGSLKTNQIQLP